ncbi:MAG TPA: phage tail sheath subtilisin-like domain-containing protein [Candidatus Entotheonella sp.]
MSTYLTPGIYVEEVSTGPRPIQALGTSTAGFVGVSPNAQARLNEAVAINNWSQFVREFVGDPQTSTPLSSAVFGFFQNGGQRCYVVNVGPNNSIAGGGRERTGLAALEPVDEVAIVAAPGYTDIASYDALLTHCEQLKDRVAILDAPGDVDASRVDLLIQVGTTSATSDDSSSAGERPSATADELTGLRPRQSEGGYGAFYFPWITIRDPFNPQSIVNVPPSGHLAGIYARTDATRGVHKAPANEPIRGALNVTYRVTHAEQGPLNEAGVNCIRFFPSQGIRVWGARTLADASSEWRYINVRRLFAMIEESIAQGTRWVVFEPNAVPLWKAIRRDVSAFLTLVWRDGALTGATPEEAFFVQCDDETNPAEVIDAGRLVVLVGIAPAKPAEFIIFRIGQYAGGAETEELT